MKPSSKYRFMMWFCIVWAVIVTLMLAANVIIGDWPWMILNLATLAVLVGEAVHFARQSSYAKKGEEIVADFLRHHR